MSNFVRRMVPRSLKDWIRSLQARIQLTSPSLARRGVGKVDLGWRKRIDDVVACPDNDRIPRVDEAGQMEGYHIVMHNGVKVCANGYYGGGNLNLLIENRGVHEPQEEWAFETIIDRLPECPVMIELGAYWGFYSLSLLKKRPRAACFLVEPDPYNLTSGKINFRLNGCRGRFLQAWIGAASVRKPRTIGVDDFCAKENIQHLHILHADIQGNEVEMLAGASRMLREKRVDYLFISTHSNRLHDACRKVLESSGYPVIASANLDETYSFDGLLVAKREGLSGPDRIEMSLRSSRDR